MDESTSPWEKLSQLIAAEDSQALITFVESLTPSETARVVSRLSEKEQHHLLE